MKRLLINMSLEDDTSKNYLEKWRLHEIIINVINNSVYIPIGIMFLFLALGFRAETFPYFTEFSWFIVIFTGFCAGITISRNKTIKIIFEATEPAKFFIFEYFLNKYVLKILGFVFLITNSLLIIFYANDIFGIFWYFVMASMTLFLPFVIFITSISDSGKIRIIFQSFFDNIDDYTKRQKWMELAFNTLEKKLRKGKIKVSSDELISKCNLKLMNSEDVKNDLIKIEKWMLGNKKEKITDSLIKFVSEKDIEPLEKDSILDIYNKFPSELRKVLFFILILVIVAWFFPEYVEKIISLL